MADTRIRLTTPKGIAKFPHLNTPDTHFDPNGRYHVTLLFDPQNADARDLLAALDQLANAASEEARQDLVSKGKKAFVGQIKLNAPHRYEIGQDGSETGMVEVKFKMKARIKTRDGREVELEPRMFDGIGNPVGRSQCTVGGGSILRVNFTPRSYYMAASRTAGVAFQLNAVQIVKLQEPAESSSLGFEKGAGVSA